MSHQIKIGCCGFPVSRARYFEAFDVVEIQQTFYHPPDISLAEKWRNESPKDFEYAMKAWQLITHDPKSPTYRKLKMDIPKGKEKNYGSFRATDEVHAAWKRTMEIADALDARVIVFQSPASFEPSDENKRNMERFFSGVMRGRHTLAWEPRGRWTPREIERVCRDLDLVHVVDPFSSSQTAGRITYFRLHGKGGYRYKYTGDDLERLKGMIRKDRDSYIMFNNVHMFEDAKRFKEMLK